MKFLDGQASVNPARKIGTTGYCMTGSYTMRLAAAMPDRIGAGVFKGTVYLIGFRRVLSKLSLYRTEQMGRIHLN